MDGWLIVAIAIGAALLVPLGVVVWNVFSWQRAVLLPDASAQPQVSVLVPARNEEANLLGCLAAIRRQGPLVAEIIVLDDHSSDATALVVRDAMASEPRLQLLNGQPLPDGWAGKCWACQQLGKAASAEWLLFIDADARLADGGISGMLNAAWQRQLSMLSCWPGFVLSGFWERLLMPLLNFLTFTFYPAPLAVLRPSDASLGLAHGACLLMRRTDYLALGGHECVRRELFEDTRLARKWRASGRRSLCLDGQDIVQVRMYQSLPEIWLGFEKNFYPAFGHWPPFVAFLGMHLFLFLLPFVAALSALVVRPSPAATALLLTACAVVLAMRLLLSLRFHHPLWSALLHPVGELFLAAIALNSWWRVASGRGVRWKGRSYLSGQSSGKEGQP